jgi:hypothetical protein
VIKQLELVRVRVPIVTVKLDDCIMVGKIGIDHKLISNQLLRLIGQAKRIQNSITSTLQLVGAKALLMQVHSSQLLSTIWVFVTTSKRTVDVVFSGRRAPESLTARLASTLDLISSLPLYLMVKATKEMFEFLQASFGDVGRLTAQFAFYGFSSSSAIAPGFSSTFGATETLASICERLKYCTAFLTRNRVVLSKIKPSASLGAILSKSFEDFRLYYPKTLAACKAVSVFAATTLRILVRLVTSQASARRRTKALVVLAAFIKKGSSATFANFGSRSIRHSRTILA